MTVTPIVKEIARVQVATSVELSNTQMILLSQVAKILTTNLDELEKRTPFKEEDVVLEAILDNANLLANFVSTITRDVCVEGEGDILFTRPTKKAETRVVGHIDLQD